ncbi:hypothetical protein D3C72_1159460 [compost metagenome]
MRKASFTAWIMPASMSMRIADRNPPGCTTVPVTTFQPPCALYAFVPMSTTFGLRSRLPAFTCSRSPAVIWPLLRSCPSMSRLTFCPLIVPPLGVASAWT